MREKALILSGGFDPVHSGHVKMFRDAKKYVDNGIVIVLLNSDEWLTRKKGKPFMNFENRYAVISGMKSIDEVYCAADHDNSVCASLKQIYDTYIEDYDICFGNGGDRKKSNVPEVELCHNLGIELVWNLGGEKVYSSSKFIKEYLK